MKQTCLPFLSVLLLVSAAVHTTAIPGGWSPIQNPNDPHVREIGQFAVTEYNKRSKAELTFQEVLKGETQVVSGTNYRLILTANEGKATNKYEAVVWEKPWEHFRNLTSFKPAK